MTTTAHEPEQQPSHGIGPITVALPQAAHLLLRYLHATTPEAQAAVIFEALRAELTRREGTSRAGDDPEAAAARMVRAFMSVPVMSWEGYQTGEYFNSTGLMYDAEELRRAVAELVKGSDPRPVALLDPVPLHQVGEGALFTFGGRYYLMAVGRRIVQVASPIYRDEDENDHAGRQVRIAGDVEVRVVSLPFVPGEDGQ